MSHSVRRHAIARDRCVRGGTGSDQDSDLDQAYCHGTESALDALGDLKAVDGDRAATAPLAAGTAKIAISATAVALDIA
jgi:hypothetical protein